MQAIEPRLKEIIRQVCLEHRVEVEELEAIPDHVHVLVSVDQQCGIHLLVKAHHRTFLPLGAPGMLTAQA